MRRTVKVFTSAFAHRLFYDCNTFTTHVTTIHFFKIVHAAAIRVANANKTTGPGGGGADAYISLLEIFIFTYNKWIFGSFC